MTSPSTPPGGKAGQPAQPAARPQGAPAPATAPAPASRAAPAEAAAGATPQAAPAAPGPASRASRAAPQAGPQRPFQAQQGLGAEPPRPPGQKPAAQAAAPGQKPGQKPQQPPRPSQPRPPQGQQQDPKPGQPAPQRPMAPGNPPPPALRPQGPQGPQPPQAQPRPPGQPIPVKPMGQAVAQPAPRPLPAEPLRPPVGIAEPRPRHWLILGSFLALVLLPSLLWAGYLWLRAEDQYVSTVGFSVRKEQSTPSIDLLGGLAPLTGAGGASDTDILYEYIRSQDMVERIDARLDLRARFARAWPHDFVFAFDPEDHVEDLTDYWQRQVKVLYDSTTQLITLKISAFTAQDAQEIAAAVFQESSDKINQLSTIAQDDATRLAKAELDKARAELTETRQAMTAFRMRSQIVDPEADLAGQMGVLSGLQAQLAEVLVAHDLLLDNAQPTDHRVTQSQQKIDALRRLIDAERAKFGAEGQGPAGESYAQLMAEYEKLAVDREFAEGAYRSARIAYETALAEAQRQARYLAAHIEPKVAQSSTEPNRPWLWAMITGMLLAGWSILVLVYYSVRDRR
ncbi:capsule biosynthesis protein [Paracoccus sp. MKU1]|uniref:capsule biosynthesis protein n=1 Tax=Paracoccus sp. MKU1 TaxID=1745182 RepID=UPI00128F636E|nr:capsule biosynthesis protein [Paracoccus sp. MKU1]